MSRSEENAGGRTITLHMVASLDGFIAKKDNSVSWLVGGAMLCQRFLELGLVDEIRLTIAPVLLGDGLRLFGGPLSEQMWKLKDVVAYKNGFVELSYSTPTG